MFTSYKRLLGGLVSTRTQKVGAARIDIDGRF